MDEKSEAQLRSEEEVRRILRERGYNQSSLVDESEYIPNKKSLVKPLLCIFCFLVVASAVFLYLQSDKMKLSNNSGDSPTVSDMSAPIVSSEKKDSSKINDTNTKKQSSGTDNSTDGEKKYQDTIAKNQAEYEKKKAELDEQTKKILQQYEQQRKEREEQYAKDKAESEEKQAKCNAFKAEYPDAESYRTKYGINDLWNVYKTAQSEYNHANSVLNSAIASGVQSRIEAAQRSVEQKRQAMNSAHSTWQSAYNNLNTAYNNLYREACL